MKEGKRKNVIPHSRLSGENQKEEGRRETEVKTEELSGSMKVQGERERGGERERERKI